MRGVWGSCHKARGASYKKEKCKLGGPTFFRCTNVITLPLLQLLLRVRLLWFVCAKTRWFSQNSTVFAEFDRSRNKNSMVFAELYRFCSKNSTAFAELDGFCGHTLGRTSLGLPFVFLYCNICHGHRGSKIPPSWPKGVLRPLTPLDPLLFYNKSDQTVYIK